MHHIIKQAVLVYHVEQLVHVVHGSHKAHTSSSHFLVDLINFFSRFVAQALFIELKISQVVDSLLEPLHETPRLLEEVGNNLNCVKVQVIYHNA